MLSGILADESPGMRVSQGSMDGHYHLEHKYDIVVVGVDGAQGMELVCAYRERFGDALVIWITDQSYRPKQNDLCGGNCPRILCGRL